MIQRKMIIQKIIIQKIMRIKNRLKKEYRKNRELLIIEKIRKDIQ